MQRTRPLLPALSLAPLLLLAALGASSPPRASAQERVAQGRAPSPPIAPVQVARGELWAGHLRLRIEQGVSFRWSDGDWIARVRVLVRNVSDQPIVVPRAALVAEGFRPWDNVSTFPANAEVPPGGALEGTIGWYQSRTLPQPASIRIAYGRWTWEAPLLYSEAESRAHGAPGVGAEHLSIAVEPTAETWLHTDGDRILRFRLRIYNPSPSPVILSGANLVAQTPAGEGTRWAQASTLPDPIRVEPGATVVGTACWYWSGDGGVPSQALLLLRSNAGVVSRSAASVMAVPPPPPEPEE